MSFFDVFKLAGMRKTLDRWEFFTPAPSPEVSDATGTSECGCETEFPKKIIQNGRTSPLLKSSLKSPAAKTKVQEGGVNVVNSAGVQWGDVEEVLFTRTVSCCSIPTDGAFPLGLGEEVEKWIYAIDARYPAGSDGEAYISPSKMPKVPTGRRSRSNSVVSSIHPFKISSEQHRVLALQENPHNWNTINDVEKNNLAFSVVELNKDIKTISDSRQQSGCSCKPTKVDSGSSKAKLISEIKGVSATVGLDVEDEEALRKLTKAELLAKAKGIVAQCELCVTNGCECVVNEVPCSQESCGCLQHGYHPELHTQSCCNPYDRVLYDRSKVRSYRTDILSSLEICRVIGASDDSVDDLSRVRSASIASTGSLDSENSLTSGSSKSNSSSLTSSPVINSNKRKKKKKTSKSGSALLDSTTEDIADSNALQRRVSLLPAPPLASIPEGTALNPPVETSENPHDDFAPPSQPFAESIKPSRSKKKSKSKVKAISWECPACTLVNPSTNGACELCGEIKK